MNERQLIKDILNGDTQSFGYFVDTYQNMALTIAFRICQNKMDAEDVVQNAFVRAYQNLNSFQKNSKFSSWFYRIVYNLSINHVNQHNRRGKELEEKMEWKTLSDDFFEEVKQKDKREEINLALSQLLKVDAVIVTLYYLEDYTVSEISKIVTLSKSNVKIKLYRARKQLKEILER